MTMSESLSKAVPTGLKIPKQAKGLKVEPATSGPKTPKTPQDEALAFFSEEKHSGEKVQVWELWLEDDGGPGENKSVCGKVSAEKAEY
jgi:glycogen debranching enzyme